jgi:signal transduction histidine kinase
MNKYVQMMIIPRYTLIAPVSEDGEVSRLIVVAVEIAGRKRAGDKLRRLNGKLEQRVTKHTAELEASNREMHAFIYTVSHDLSAPLGHIDGFLELLQACQGGHYR